MAGFKRRTLQELLSVDLNKLTKAELQGYKKVARDEVARTLKRWEGREYKSPAYYAFEKLTGGTNKISFRGKTTLQQQKKELAKAIRFLSDPTVSVEGWKAEKQRNLSLINAHFNKETAEEFTTVDYDRLYEAYNKAKQIDKNIEAQEFRYAVFEALIDKIKDESIDIEQIALEMAEKTKEIYEQNEQTHRANEASRSARYKEK